MAKIQTIGFNFNEPDDPEQSEKIINLSASVGANGVNLRDDVVVVQALLKYAIEPRQYPEFRGTQFPEPTGASTKATIELIKNYQRFNNRRNRIKVSIDGRIDPLKDGVHIHGTSRRWTIYALHVDALETGLLSRQKSPIEGICRRWSFIRRILNKDGVGTLGLSLESFAPSIGSLNLSLS
jgi:hypothetical protein